MRVAVIGAGIAGLAAAERLTGAGIDTVVFESSERLGGKVADVAFGDHVVPTAADNFLARRPEVRQLVERVGLSDELINPAAGSARIFRGGTLYPIPPSVLGVPADLEALETSGLVSPDGMERARLDLDVPSDATTGDESVGALIRRRLGDEVHEYLVEPLLGGINAGDSDRLSLLSGAPQLLPLRDSPDGLVRAAGRLRANADPDVPVFESVRGGLGRLLDAVGDHIAESGRGVIRFGADVQAIRPTDDQWSVNGEVFDQVVLAVPASIAAGLLADLDPATAEILRSVEYSSVAMLLLQVPADSFGLGPEISGVLVPRLEGRFVTAVSVATNKWPGMLPEGEALLRVSVGRRTDHRWQELDDEALTESVLADLPDIIGLDAPPSRVHVVRWLDALPQFDVDHHTRVAAIGASLLRTAPGVHLAGAYIDGLGLPACVASGWRAADACMHR